jgi:hypothetical protein
MAALLAALIDSAEVVLVGIWVIAMDFKDLRNESPAGPSFKLHDNV